MPDWYAVPPSIVNFATEGPKALTFQGDMA